MKGKLRIHNKRLNKNGKIYNFQQAVIYVKSSFLQALLPYDGQEIEFSIGSAEQSQSSQKASSKLQNLLVLLFTKAFSDQSIASKLLQKYPSLIESILNELEKEGNL